MLNAGENFGHYEVRSAIGAGGMGEIYQVFDTRLRRVVAIKILPAELILNPSAVERFMREAHAASALNHPNILTIYDIGEHGGVHFIATDFVEGQTLRQKMQESPLNLAAALDIAIQSAAALAAAHTNGIIHRDIKPENIMIRGDGYVKVLDFGIAKLTEREPRQTDANAATLIQAVTNPGMIIGTVNYMSPEQARGLKVDTRSDIFSLGITIYEMVAGCLPFYGETLSDVLAAILKSEPKPLSEAVKNVPLELERSIAKALCKDCEQRYQTMTELAADLKVLRQRLEFETEMQRVNHPNISDAARFGQQATVILPKKASVVKPQRKRRKAIDSLAVLPFTNDAGNAKTEYLIDGITETIINSLSNLPKLRIVPRSTVFRYKGHADLQAVGEELGVRAVFAGRVIQIGKALIIKVD